jgi:hypothetical protein
MEKGTAFEDNRSLESSTEEREAIKVNAHCFLGETIFSR